MIPPNNDLFNTLMQRQTGLPVTPPSEATKVPQEAKRFDNAQQIQSAYANGWSPNPVLLRTMLGHR